MSHKGHSQADRIAQRAIECQEAAAALCPNDYESRVGEWRDLLRSLSKAHGWPLIDVVYSLTKDLETACGGGSHDKLSGALMWLYAAFAEEVLDQGGGAA